MIKRLSGGNAGRIYFPRKRGRIKNFSIVPFGKEQYER